MNGSKFVKTLKPVCLVVGLALLCLPACRQGAEESAIDSDANGYFCLKCEMKFYTVRDVFAEFCPRCSDAGIRQVAAFVCSRDQSTVMAPRGGPGVVCPQCANRVETVRFPSELELKKWNASKKSKTEVCRN